METYETQPWFSRYRERVHMIRAGSATLLRLLGYLRFHKAYTVWTALFGSAGFLLAFVFPWIAGAIIDLSTGATGVASEESRTLKLLWLTGVAGLSGLLSAIVVYGRGHCNTLLGDAVVADLRKELFDHLQRLSVRFYTKERTGEILGRVMQDVQDATSIIYIGVLVVAFDSVQLLLALILLVGISPKLTLACAFVLPTYGLVIALLNPAVRRASDRVREQLGLLSGNMAECLSGQVLVKTYTAEEREARKFRQQIDRHHELVMAQSHAGHLVSSSAEVLVHLGTTVVLGYGGWLVMRSELTAGELTQFLGYLVVLFGPVRRFSELNITYQSSLSALRRIFRVLAIPPAITDRPHAHPHPPRIGGIRFEQVRFRFSDTHHESEKREGLAHVPARHPQWVLDGVDLEIAAGECVALVGPSGAGKSTLLSLVSRLYEVSSGRVVVDGRDVRDYSLEALRSAIAVVQQDTFLFSGSIRDNIAYGRPGASEKAIVEAARAAHAHDFILRCPDGYSAHLGERGVNLSGGQRQRISIARALLKDPRILILDEATSALDAESEAMVQEALKRLMQGRTCLITAHRMSTIQEADRILVLEGGQIVEDGSHTDLLAQNAHYARIVHKQWTLEPLPRGQRSHPQQ